NPFAEALAAMDRENVHIAHPRETRVVRHHAGKAGLLALRRIKPIGACVLDAPPEVFFRPIARPIGGAEHLQNRVTIQSRFIGSDLKAMSGPGGNLQGTHTPLTFLIIVPPPVEHKPTPLLQADEHSLPSALHARWRQCHPSHAQRFPEAYRQAGRNYTKNRNLDYRCRGGWSARNTSQYILQARECRAA